MSVLHAPRVRTIALVAAGVPLLALLVLVAAWAIDASTGGTQVLRNVSVADRDVGGLSEEDLVSVLEEVSAEVDTARVELVLPATRLASTAADLGLQLDQRRTAEAALDLGRNDPLLARPFTWLASFFRRREAPLRFEVNGTKVASTVAQLEQQVREDATEPALTYEGGRLVVVPGRPGRKLDPAQVAGKLGRVDDLSGDVLAIPVETSDLQPKYTDAEIQELANELMEATNSPPLAVLDGVARPLDGDKLRRLLTVAPEGGSGSLVPVLAPEGTLTHLSELFEGVGTEPVDATVGVSGGQVVVDDGEPGTGCCDPAGVDAIAAALRTGADRVDLALTARPPARDANHYAQLGLREKVAEFTTRHPGGAPRVANIHRIADLVRGVVIEPGETFSVNDHVGPRTLAKGFVAAPVIGENGYFTDDVGGGVSQFATTMFNAAFFAGLEIPEYQAHGIYISRYPYGREATLDYGNIDLQVRNNTPYGVLLWPTYTDTSITVEIYSTRYIEAGQSDQFEEQYGAVCTRVTTVRKRTILTTGEERFDRFYALYTPSEGLQCDGTTLSRPDEPPPASTAPAPADTTPTTAAPTDPTATSAPADTTPTSAAAAASGGAGGGPDPPATDPSG